MTARLGVNIDHVATLREVRNALYPSVTEAAKLAIKSGADGITVHLREDRRHIQDYDIVALQEILSVPMNLEISTDPEMVALALEYHPEHVCLVPERREELTTEGGLDLIVNEARVAKAIEQLKRKDIQVSLFIDPDEKQIRAAATLKADVIEIHTGRYAEPEHQAEELAKIKKMSKLATQLGLEVHAGHGLTLDNLPALLEIDEIKEFNIGHAIVAHAVFVGLDSAIKAYKQCLSLSQKC